MAFALLGSMRIEDAGAALLELRRASRQASRQLAATPVAKRVFFSIPLFYPMATNRTK